MNPFKRIPEALKWQGSYQRERAVLHHSFIQTDTKENNAMPNEPILHTILLEPRAKIERVTPSKYICVMIYHWLNPNFLS